MTDLREARIAEAVRRWHLDRDGSGEDLARITTDLIEQDWRPEPEVDPVTLAAREWGAADCPWNAEVIKAGRCDTEAWVRAFRAGHADGQATCADVRRMDWLEGQDVTISWTFNHIPERSEPLRTKIDRAMEGGE
jgi:hypothetical protein